MMATKKPTAEEQIASMETVLAGYKSQLAETTKDLETERTTRRENRDIAEKWRKRAGELESEVGALREELHGLTVEKARLKDNMDRPREPAPPQEVRLVTVPEEMVRHFRKDGYGGPYMPGSP